MFPCVGPGPLSRIDHLSFYQAASKRQAQVLKYKSLVTQDHWWQSAVPLGRRAATHMVSIGHGSLTLTIRRPVGLSTDLSHKKNDNMVIFEASTLKTGI